jgi:predicted NAD/FAD-binding protein
MESIAIIGTGISGMGAGYLLRNEYDITFYEKENRTGGHTHTLTVDEDGKDINVDCGFMVFNKKTYPNLIRLFDELDVEEMETSMSFSVQYIPERLEWKGTGFNNLFCQRSNIFNLRFIKMLWDVNKFGQQADEIINNPKYEDYSLGEYVKEKNIGQDFLLKFMIPMSAAIWSSPPELILDFPVVSLSKFFKNHGFIGLSSQVQWYTVPGGTHKYKEKLLAHFKGKILLEREVVDIKKTAKGVMVKDKTGEEKRYDKVILATHSDQALKILHQPTDLEANLLSKMAYQPHDVKLHTDESVMPKLKRAWASWNYRMDYDQAAKIRPANVYWMNELQKVSDKRNYFISVEDMGDVADAKVLERVICEHPLFDKAANKAQKELARLNENGPIYFCGAYFSYGFHEDGLTSGINVARRIAGDGIW